MAAGPDPNRFTPTDGELEPKDYRRGDSVGDSRTTRLGFSSWGIVVLAAVVLAAVLILTR